jgi:hypothetical protein
MHCDSWFDLIWFADRADRPRCRKSFESTISDIRKLWCLQFIDSRVAHRSNHSSMEFSSTQTSEIIVLSINGMNESGKKWIENWQRDDQRSDQLSDEWRNETMSRSITGNGWTNQIVIEIKWKHNKGRGRKVKQVWSKESNLNQMNANMNDEKNECEFLNYWLI